MKNIKMITLALTPVVIGYIFNMLVMVPMWGQFFYYAVPIATIFFWIYAGTQFAREIPNFAVAAVCAHMFGILSLVVFFSQQFLVPVEQQNNFIASISQMFSSTMTPLVARLAILFEPDRTVITQIFINAVALLGFLVMFIVFIIGFILGTKKVSIARFLYAKMTKSKGGQSAPTENSEKK